MCVRTPTHLAMVLVRIVGGELVPEIEVSGSDTVLDLKLKITEMLGVEVSRQVLSLNGVFMLDDEEICDCLIGTTTLATVEVNLDVERMPEGSKANVRLISRNKRWDMKVREMDSGGHLRGKIERRWGLEPDSVTLFRLSSRMKEELPLATYYVCDGTEIEVRYVLFDEGR